MASNFNIKTPHAAVIVWNYKDRIGSEKMSNSHSASGVDDLHGVEQTIISTLSCVSIETSKSKGQPSGEFRLVLAPYKNWVSTITAGSWCCILMSNEPITAEDLKKANPKLVKMIGKIETVRVETQQVEDTRQTRYFVSGVDWGHIFNNIVYVDNLIAAANDPKTQGNAAAVALRNALFGKNGTPTSFHVDDNLRAVMNIFGSTLDGFTQAGNDINRLAKSIYSFNIPKEMVEYFNFSGPKGRGKINKTKINELLTLKSGVLTGPDKYEPSNEALGFINPFSLQGQHTFWQILLENSNPAMNEMFSDMRWNADKTLSLVIYNRIKPFAYKNFKPGAGASNNLKSYFQYIATHRLDDASIISINAGSNWRDKYNFIEIKPEFQDFNIIANWTKQKSQVYDAKSFEREGFRPLIIETKQFPSKGAKVGAQDTLTVDPEQLSGWAKAMREWYFNTHRMLNGTIVLYGTTDYIGVGDNIKFSAGLINPTPNMVSTKNKPENLFVLGHVESVSHSFTVNGDARTYRTTIQFVRGIIVDSDNVVAGRGTLDKFATSISQQDERNTKNTVSTSSENDPDKHIKGK